MCVCVCITQPIHDLGRRCRWVMKLIISGADDDYDDGKPDFQRSVEKATFMSYLNCCKYDVRSIRCHRTQLAHTQTQTHTFESNAYPHTKNHSCAGQKSYLWRIVLWLVYNIDIHMTMEWNTWEKRHHSASHHTLLRFFYLHLWVSSLSHNHIEANQLSHTWKWKERRR